MAFVQLASPSDVEAALKLHQSELDGRWINVERCEEKTTMEGSEKGDSVGPSAKKAVMDPALSVFVAQLPYSADVDAVRQFFEEAGVEGVLGVKMISENNT